MLFDVIYVRHSFPGNSGVICSVRIEKYTSRSECSGIRIKVKADFNVATSVIKVFDGCIDGHIFAYFWILRVKFYISDCEINIGYYLHCFTQLVIRHVVLLRSISINPHDERMISETGIPGCINSH